MEFELTPEITDEIIFAMEDQTGRYIFDSTDNRCIPDRERPRSAAESVFDDENDRYFDIPSWDSLCGFRMMERFTAQLRNPLVRESLRSALSSGRGVFRNFKNILKEHPEIERLWFKFKEREMRNIVLDWYNSLRDFWGLERIGMELEETGEIVSQDFQFRLASGGDERQVSDLLAAAAQELYAQPSGDLSGAAHELWSRLAGLRGGSGECVIVAEGMEGDIVGVAVSAPIPDGGVRVSQLVAVAVYPEFRGLGIGKELLSRTIGHWARGGFRWLLFSAPFMPEIFFPVLHRSGFIEKGHVSVLDLSGIVCH